MQQMEKQIPKLTPQMNLQNLPKLKRMAIIMVSIKV